MAEYLPDPYVRFRTGFPPVAAALDDLGAAADAAGPLDEQTRRLVRLGVAIGAMAEGAVRSNARKALDAGVDPEALRHAVVLAIATRGLPSVVAALGWVDAVIEARG
ncbi:MAG TPA: carboxymuconolactone decarboxylase family protein [Acidimicrobiia bacterium]|nr:carboxymuconolactone decarboxylase family protein [Acidimicrobiia bacterium]